MMLVSLEACWILVAIFASSGLPLALLSCLKGLRPNIENPLWWINYLVWIVVIHLSGCAAPFGTALLGSIGAGLVHGLTTALLIDSYLKNNPWHAEKMEGAKSSFALRFVITGFVAGIVMGAVVGGIAWGLARL